MSRPIKDAPRNIVINQVKFEKESSTEISKTKLSGPDPQHREKKQKKVHNVSKQKDSFQIHKSATEFQTSTTSKVQDYEF